MPETKFPDASALSQLSVDHDPKAYHEQYTSVEKLLELLGTSAKEGLSAKEAENKFAERQEHFGKNVLPEPPLRSLFELIFEGLQDTTLIMLMISAVISLILGLWENPSHGWIEGFAILVAVFLVVSVASANDYQKERQFRKLNEKKENKSIKVIRAGTKTEVSCFDINVGDIVILATGDALIADGVIIESSNLSTDNSAVTGETEEIKINQEFPFLFGGTAVCEGYGKMVVTSVGPLSTSGRLMETLQSRGEDTPLQEKLSSLANDQIATAGIIAATLILICLVIKLGVTTYIYDLPVGWHIVSQIIKYFITSVTIVVVAVPEGLPLAVTIALAYSMLQMVRDQNLVRHLVACETMGGATVICSDKTGTLTLNQMTVVKGWFGQTYEQVEDLKNAKLGAEFQEALHEGINLNTTVYEGKNQNKETVFIGNKTECALLGFSKALGANFSEYQERFHIEKLYPFSSVTKTMGCVIKREKGLRFYAKGASEIISLRCTQYLDVDGTVKPIDKKLAKELQEIILTLASQGLRTIGLTYRDYSDNEYKSGDWEEQPAPEDSILVGVAAIKDPLRPEVKDAVEQCKKAGIQVKMVTGDNINTAKKIASECGILTEGGVAIEGPEFRKLSDKQREEMAPKIQVMARSSPNDKYLLVSALKNIGEVVAVTGDGTNDAPALKEAHVGFSMGIQGTEVAKEASDIILMDDNFSSIVKAVSWGRNVYDSIRKFLQFQLTVNMVAVSLAFIGAITNEHGESPLKPVQLLWVNLIMDTMAALALATDAPSPQLLERRPYGKNDALITRRMWLNMIGQATFQLTINLVVLYMGPSLFGVEADSVKHRTLVFNIFVMCQIFNEINCRKLGQEINVFEGLLTNHICLGVFVFTLVIQYLMVQFGGEFTGTTALTTHEWLVSCAIGVMGLPIGFVLRLIPVPEPVPVKDVSSSSSSSSSANSVVARVLQASKNSPNGTKREAPSPALQRWGKVRVATKQLSVVNYLQKRAALADKLRRKHRVPTPGFYTTD